MQADYNLDLSSYKAFFPKLHSVLHSKIDIRSGNVRFKSSLTRFLGTFVPSYHSKKSEELNLLILNKLKNFYAKNPESKIQKGILLASLANAVLELNPSSKTDKQIQLYTQAILFRTPDLIQSQRLQEPIGFNQQLAELGLSARSQALFPDFVEFAKTNLLIDYMQGADRLFEMSEWEEPMIPINGVMTSWTEARSLLFPGPLRKTNFLSHDSEKSKRLPKEWRFDSEGISHISTWKWEKLEPCNKEADHDGKFYVEVMSTKVGLNHCWLRLLDNEGQIYSIGLCGKIRTVGFCRGSKGRINSPDHREFLPEERRITRILITQNQFEKLKEKIETDQNTKNLYFNLLTRNCSAWVCEVLKVINIPIDNREFPSQILVRKCFNKIKINPPECILKFFGSITLVARWALGTLIAALGGAWYQDEKVERLERKHGDKWKTKPIKPFRTIMSFFNGTNHVMASSFKLAAWQGHVDRTRKARLEELKKHKSTISSRIRRDPKFIAAWKELKCKIAYERPTDEGHLYISKDLPIDTSDISESVSNMVKKLYL